jgi:flavin-dependent dehydrogenase
VTTHQVDVAIVGGGPAGISTALHLRAASPWIASRTVVLEKQRYPREKICAGAVGARALRALEALGIDVTGAVPHVAIDAIALRVGGEIVELREPGLGIVARRVELDHALARAARARGIEVRDGCGVTAIAVDDDHGVRIETDTGDVYRAACVVGADGVGGVVRRFTGFPRGELRAQVVEVDTPAIAGDAPRDTLVFDLDARDLAGYAWDFPTIVGGAPLVCRGIYVIRSGEEQGSAGEAQPSVRTMTGRGGLLSGAAGEARARIEGYLAARGMAAADFRLKHYAERGFEPGAAIARPRVILVGEAAGIDIATGEGIAQAIEYGAVAGPYLARALTGGALDFGDWRGVVDRAHVGWQLWVRHACYRAFFSPGRARLERMVPSLRAMLGVGVKDFAGAPQSVTGVMRGAAQLIAAVSREAFRRSP